MIEYPKFEGLLPACVFADGMLLQQEKTVPVWGLARPGGTVTVTLEREGKILTESQVVADADGTFYLELPPQKGSFASCSLTIAAAGKQMVYRDILFGEVYLAAGQSNMEFTNHFSRDGKRLRETANNPYIRFCKVYRADDSGERVRKRAPQFLADVKWGKGDNGADVDWASAIGYAFALCLYQKLGRAVPVGFVDIAQGGVRVETYLTSEQVEKLPRLQKILREEKRGMDLWGKHGAENYNEVTGVYNERVSPMQHLKFRGILWYQGEGNVGSEEKCADYIETFEEMCAGFDCYFGDGEEKLPVIYAMLAPYTYSVSGVAQHILPLFWEAQHDIFLRNRDRMRVIPIYDLPLDYAVEELRPLYPPEQFHPIHPICKFPVGSRMADAAMELVYSKGTPYIPPHPIACRKEGEAFILTLSGDCGLRTNDAVPLRGFCLCGANRQFVAAQAEFCGEQEIRLTADEVADPTAATYAFHEICSGANLCDQTGVMAVPFRTDRVPSAYCVKEIS